MPSMMTFTNGSKSISNLVNQIRYFDKRDGIDLRPSYQRAYIWKADFKDKLIYSLIRKYPIGNISLRVRVDERRQIALNEVVDGQQRLTTIYKFINNDYTVQGDISRKIVEYIVEYMGDEDDPKLKKLKNRLQGKGKIPLKYNQLPDAIQNNINAFDISMSYITNATDSEIAEYFRFLQNQEQLRAGEIINSVPETVLEDYLKKINNLEVLLSMLSYNNTRKQFDRVFYCILGLLDGQLAFGVMDKDVMSFASDCKELNESTIPMVELLISQLNSIGKDESIPTKYVSYNVRAMKFLLLLTSLGLVDFSTNTKDKLARLDHINHQLSAFSSAQADKVKKEFTDYSEPVIEEYRLLALISKGGHSFKRVKNRMEILAYYMNDFSNKTKPSGISPV